MAKWTVLPETPLIGVCSNVCFGGLWTYYSWCVNQSRHLIEETYLWYLSPGVPDYIHVLIRVWSANFGTHTQKKNRAPSSHLQRWKWVSNNANRLVWWCWSPCPMHGRLRWLSLTSTLSPKCPGAQPRSWARDSVEVCQLKLVNYLSFVFLSERYSNTTLTERKEILHKSKKKKWNILYIDMYGPSHKI